MLAANSTITLQRSAGLGLEFTTPTYYDGQAFVVPKKLGINGATALASRGICTLRGTTHEDNLKAWFGERRLKATPILFDNQDAMYEAFFQGRCVAVTQDSTALAATIVRSGKAADYMMLPEIISREPLGPYVRRGDDAWADVVRWTQYAMLEAEALGITRDKVERVPAQQRSAGAAAARRHARQRQGARARRDLGLQHRRPGRELRRKLRAQCRQGLGAEIRPRNQRAVEPGRADVSDALPLMIQMNQKLFS